MTKEVGGKKQKYKGHWLENGDGTKCNYWEKKRKPSRSSKRAATKADWTKRKASHFRQKGEEVTKIFFKQRRMEVLFDELAKPRISSPQYN